MQGHANAFMRDTDAQTVLEILGCLETLTETAQVLMLRQPQPGHDLRRAEELPHSRETQQVIVEPVHYGVAIRQNGLCQNPL